MDKIKRFLPHGLAIYSAIIFLSSLPFKFSNDPNTQVIFGKLNDWAASFGADGLFLQTGLFSQYVIGSAELVASLLLLLGITTRFRRLQGFGAVLGLAVMTGAISFHLFTPLGIDPNKDGGGLFVAACFVWLSCAALIFIHRAEICAGVKQILGGLFGQPIAK